MTSLYFIKDILVQSINLKIEKPHSTMAIQEIAQVIESDYFIWQLKPGVIKLEQGQVAEWIDFTKNKNAAISYSNYIQVKEGKANETPTIEYHLGSIRDDFDFGAAVVIQKQELLKYLGNTDINYDFAGWYDFRLAMTRQDSIAKFDCMAYSYQEEDLRQSGEKIFDYVNPMNRERQIEMEHAATIHLEKIGAKVSPPFENIKFKDNFPVEASVIIPVLNREKTIADAIGSVLKQKTDFPFNLIIVDNHSTDKTSETIDSFIDDRLVHHIPLRDDLGIGGCWNEGVNHQQCGKFAIQLDSDDLYSDENTLQTIVDKFHQEKCAMVIGSYQMVNFKLEEIPPGVIDHKEWSDDNGPNNALRINGLGAPRAFYTPVIRDIGFPNVSYGEDYAVALAISRTYKIGRIYNPIYLCRRWENNTDSNLSIEKMNAHNAYKDSIRKTEIKTRTSF